MITPNPNIRDEELRKPLGLHLAPPLDRQRGEFVQEWDSGT